MNLEIPTRRFPWLALALSLLSAGVGHLYCGRIVKGLPFYFAWLLVPLCLAIAATLPSSSTVLVLLVLLPILVVFGLYLYSAFDAWQIAQRMDSNYFLRDYNRTSVYALMIVVQMVYSLGVVFAARGLIYEPYYIPVDSMSPTIIRGDRVLAKKWMPVSTSPERGDLVVYRNPTDEGANRFLGRVAAVGGDQVQIIGDRLLINGIEMERDRAPTNVVERMRDHTTGQIELEHNAGRRYLVIHDDQNGPVTEEATFETEVPANQVFVLGDHRDRSRDSRHFGSIPLVDVVGYVEYIYWPSASWSRFGTTQIHP